MLQIMEFNLKYGYLEIGGYNLTVNKGNREFNGREWGGLCR